MKNKEVDLIMTKHGRYGTPQNRGGSGPDESAARVSAANSWLCERVSESFQLEEVPPKLLLKSSPRQPLARVVQRPQREAEGEQRLSRRQV